MNEVNVENVDFEAMADCMGLSVEEVHELYKLYEQYGWKLPAMELEAATTVDGCMAVRDQAPFDNPIREEACGSSRRSFQ
jgi:hypothetical protein